MAWQDEALPLLRAVIGDDDTPYVYCDTRLIDLMVSVAKLLIFELSFETAYTVTISTLTIDPDPETDQFFIPLLVLKSATKIVNSEYKTAANNSVQIVDGPSSISLAGQASALKERVKRINDEYDKAKMQYALGQGIGFSVILSPTTTSQNVNNVYPLNDRIAPY